MVGATATKRPPHHEASRGPGGTCSARLSPTTAAGRAGCRTPAREPAPRPAAACRTAHVRPAPLDGEPSATTQPGVGAAHQQTASGAVFLSADEANAAAEVLRETIALFESSHSVRAHAAHDRRDSARDPAAAARDRRGAACDRRDTVGHLPRQAHRLHRRSSPRPRQSRPAARHRSSDAALLRRLGELRCRARFPVLRRMVGVLVGHRPAWPATG